MSFVAAATVTPKPAIKRAGHPCERGQNDRQRGH